jgi:hypothetical protein
MLKDMYLEKFPCSIVLPYLLNVRGWKTPLVGGGRGIFIIAIPFIVSIFHIP